MTLDATVTGFAMMETKTNERIKRCTITINRACNLRCVWCYAQDTEFKSEENITVQTFDDILSFCRSANIKEICIIGGEPTIHPLIFDFLEKLKEYKVSIVTNGVVLSDIELCKKYIAYGVRNFSVSIKAPSKEEYREVTKVDAFDKAICAIKNLIDLKVNVCVSYVITKDNIDTLLNMVENINALTGCEKFFFSFCRTYQCNCNEAPSGNENPLYLTKRFEEILPQLKAKVNKMVYALNDPLCIYSDDFIRKNIKDFYFPCYVHTNTMLVFDSQGYLIPCNTIHQIKIGKIGEDFSNFQEYSRFTESEKYKNIYKKLRGIPADDCLNCKLFQNCQGRCVCNWTNYSYNDINRWKQNDNRFLFNNRFSNNQENSELLKIVAEIESVNVDEMVLLSDKKYKVIFGIAPYKNSVNLLFNVKNSIYDRYTGGKVAFIPNDNTVRKNRKFNSSVMFLLTLLFGSIDFSVKLLDYLASKDMLNKLAGYLLNKGIVLLNLDDLNITEDQVEEFMRNFESVLICGKGDEKTDRLHRTMIVDFIKSNQIPASEIIHPSAVNIEKNGFMDVWLYRDQMSDWLSPVIAGGQRCYLTDFQII